MIQRIQTLYMAVVIVLNLVLVFIASSFEANGLLKEGDTEIVSVMVATIITITALAIVSYKKRQNQFVLNRLNMILNLFLLGFFVYRSLNLPGEMAISEKGIGMLIPVFSIVFLVLANRAIKKDEDLVKSVDRLR